MTQKCIFQECGLRITLLCIKKKDKQHLVIDFQRKFRKWFMYGLTAQKPLAQSNGYKQHALKGQKLLAQGSALGIMAIGKAPCKVGCSKFASKSAQILS